MEHVTDLRPLDHWRELISADSVQKSPLLTKPSSTGPIQSAEPLTFEKAPSRAVADGQNSAEVFYLLGLGDKVVVRPQSLIVKGYSVSWAAPVCALQKNVAEAASAAETSALVLFKTRLFPTEAGY